jgi:hypothetical protein
MAALSVRIWYPRGGKPREDVSSMDQGGESHLIGIFAHHERRLL